MGMYIGILTYRPRRLSPPYFLRQPLPPPPACLASPPPTASLPSPHLVFPSSPYPAQIHQFDQLLTEETLTLLPHCHFPILQLLPSLHSHPQNFRSSRILITPSSQELDSRSIMANPRQRNKARSHKSTKPSQAIKRRLHHKLRKAPPLKGPEVLQSGWDRKKTVFQKWVYPYPSLISKPSGGRVDDACFMQLCSAETASEYPYPEWTFRKPISTS